MVIQARGCICSGDGGLDFGCSNGSNKKYSDSGFILEVELWGFPDWKWGRTVRDGVGVFDLNDGRMDLPWTGGGGEWGWRK